MREITVLNEPVVSCQPRVSVAYKSGGGIEGVQLQVNRWYANGKRKSCDADGMLFPTQEEAGRYALEHGYVRPYSRPAFIKEMVRKNLGNRFNTK